MPVTLKGVDNLVSQTIDRINEFGEDIGANDRYDEAIHAVHTVTGMDNPLIRKWKSFSKFMGEISHSFRIFNIPIVNYGILSIFGYLLIKLSFKYHQLYTRSSILATIFTNVVLYGISDTCAQSITMFNENRRNGLQRLSNNRINHIAQINLRGGNGFTDNDSRSSFDNSNIFIDYGDDDEGETVNGSNDVIIDFENLDDIENGFNHVTFFNFRRFFGFITWGFIMAFIQVVWYMFLNSMFTDMPAIVSVLERDLTDQLIFSPISLSCFFAYTTIIIEGKSKEEYKDKMYKLYITTLAISFSVWFPVQFINFSVMPKKFQVPFSSSIGVMWNCFLSYRNAKASLE